MQCEGNTTSEFSQYNPSGLFFFTLDKLSVGCSAGCEQWCSVVLYLCHSASRQHCTPLIHLRVEVLLNQLYFKDEQMLITCIGYVGTYVLIGDQVISEVIVMLSDMLALPSVEVYL
jgi:hypothetical protein